MENEQFKEHILSEYGKDILSQFENHPKHNGKLSFSDALNLLDEIISPVAVYPSFGRTNSRSEDGYFKFKFDEGGRLIHQRNP